MSRPCETIFHQARHINCILVCQWAHVIQFKKKIGYTYLAFMNNFVTCI
uniref:Uncharacterized protein n=1 Tax=Arundo donax TaxID=35708 RepID=A0A0A9EPB6_ARUDO